MFLKKSIYLSLTKHRNLFLHCTICFSTGARQQRVFAIGADWISVCVLLRAYPVHSVYCHVVPSLRNDVTHLGLHRIELLFQQEDRRSIPGCAHRQGGIK